NQKAKNGHPAQQTVSAPGLAGQVENQPGDPQRQREGVGGQPQLIEQEVVGAANADIAGADVVQEVERDKVMLELPDQVGQEDEQREGHAAPQPGAAQVAAGRRQQHGQDQGGHTDGDGIFGHHAQADDGSNGRPPAGIVRLEQAYHQVG